jgi:phosphoglycolate phosphatase
MGKLWIFDFDGTLVDSEAAIKHCYLKVTEKLLPERINFVKNILIGPTLEETTQIILTNKNLHLKNQFMKEFQSQYDSGMVLETPIYPNVNEVLQKLKNNGDSLSVLTNKRAIPTHKLIKHYKWDNFFDWVACMDEYPDLKNKSELLKKQDIPKKNYSKILLVGDTLNDGITAEKNEIDFIKVNYGYGREQDWQGINIFKSIDKFDELLLI